jgi:hypothetical protein
VSQEPSGGGHPYPTAHQPLCPDQEIKTSVKVSAAMKIAKMIQYIIHRTCGAESIEVS